MRKKVFVFFALLALIGFITYAYLPIHTSEFFVCISLTHPKAPINMLCSGYHPLRAVYVHTPVAVDAMGRIYIVGIKKSKVQVVVVNRHGKIERVITPRWQDGHFLPFCFHISVSPSGKHIWTIGWDRGVSVKKVVHRVTVHNRNGESEGEWLIGSYGTTELLLNAYSEYGAYVIASDVACFRFEIGQEKLQEFKISENFRVILPTFFHNGKYWSGWLDLDWLTQRFGTQQSEQQITKPEVRKGLFGIVIWSPEEGIQIVSSVGFPMPLNIQWIDEQGNLYSYCRGHYSIHLPSIVEKIPILEKLFKNFGIFENRLYPVIPKILVFSPKGKPLDVISLPAVIRPKNGEKLEYGQLVKVDETGIYLEVAKVNEPREYRIVKIVKKPRWKVWWEKITGKG